jgi:DNA-binding NarL/FixJ family response regulator
VLAGRAAAVGPVVGVHLRLRSGRRRAGLRRRGCAAGSPALVASRQRCHQQAHDRLGEHAYRAAVRAGEDLDLDSAVAYALDEQQPAVTTRPASWAPLTRREREIAEHVAKGLTNQQIATRLVISKRTAEAHIQHILTKLGFTNRAQIARWVAERRPSTTYGSTS